MIKKGDIVLVSGGIDGRWRKAVLEEITATSFTARYLRGVLKGQSITIGGRMRNLSDHIKPAKK